MRSRREATCPSCAQATCPPGPSPETSALRVTGPRHRSPGATLSAPESESQQVSLGLTDSWSGWHVTRQGLWAVTLSSAVSSLSLWGPSSGQGLPPFRSRLRVWVASDRPPGKRPAPYSQSRRPRPCRRVGSSVCPRHCLLGHTCAESRVGPREGRPRLGPYGQSEREWGRGQACLPPGAGPGQPCPEPLSLLRLPPRAPPLALRGVRPKQDGVGTPRPVSPSYGAEGRVSPSEPQAPGQDGPRCSLWARGNMQPVGAGPAPGCLGVRGAVPWVPQDSPEQGRGG